MVKKGSTFPTNKQPPSTESREGKGDCAQIMHFQWSNTVKNKVSRLERCIHLQNEKHLSIHVQISPINDRQQTKIRPISLTSNPLKSHMWVFALEHYFGIIVQYFLLGNPYVDERRENAMEKDMSFNFFINKSNNWECQLACSCLQCPKGKQWLRKHKWVPTNTQSRGNNTD